MEQDTVLHEVSEEGILTITLNNPKKLNAWSTYIYSKVRDLLIDARFSTTIKAIILTGCDESRYYSAGNDLQNLMPTDILDEQTDGAARGALFCQQFVQSFIDCNKPIIAAVTGPAMGIATTTLFLCDFVFATSDATFQTNFAQLAQGPQGCSSILFPRYLGKALASQMILLGKKVTAADYLRVGFLSGVFPNKKAVKAKALEVAKTIAGYDSPTILACKRLMKHDQELLTAANKQENDNLFIRWKSEASKEAAIKFLSKKNKKKPKL